MTDGAETPRRAALLADIGGTHARFTLQLDDGTLTPILDLPSGRFRELRAAVTESLSLLWRPLPFEVSIREAAVAVAGPVTGDRIELTNVAWSFSLEETKRALGFDRLVAVNDVAALAWAVPELDAGNERSLFGGHDGTEAQRRKAFIEGNDGRRDERQRSMAGEKKGERRKTSFEARDGGEAGVSGRVGGGSDVAAVVAVGTGLGVATWARSTDGEAEVVLESEGGHRDLAATTSREWSVVERLRVRFGPHVSVERAVSGQGLANLWTALAELDGETVEVEGEGERRAIRPDEVTRRAAAGEERAVEALGLLAGWLGAFAGDLALTMGARGGIWIGGGVIGAIEAAGATLDRARIRERFLDKGRFEEWLGAVPVRAIDDPLAAFRGLSRALAASR